MNVLVASTQCPYVSGGAEVLAAGLIDGLRAMGHRAEQLLVPFFPRPIDHVVQSMQMARTIEIGESNFGAIDRLITLMFPAYLIDHPHKTLWLVHQYRQFYELWDEPGMGFAAMPFGEQLRGAVARADRLYLPQHRALFAISNTVARRLRESTSLEAETLYPPLAESSGYSCDEAEDYFLFPGRLSVLKRQDLVLEALARTRSPVRVRFIGGVDEDASLDWFTRLAAAAGVEGRVEYLGCVNESDKRTLYARAIGVVFPPRLEDLGLVAQEAMQSSKPVITCTDSGGVLEFVGDRENGLVTEPAPEALANALDLLWTDRPLAARFGARGFDRLRAMNLSWPIVVQRLLGDR
jgi:glycosyltransferase involved in cell wall biosynthesis